MPELNTSMPLTTGRAGVGGPDAHNARCGGGALARSDAHRATGVDGAAACVDLDEASGPGRAAPDGHEHRSAATTRRGARADAQPTPSCPTSWCRS